MASRLTRVGVKNRQTPSNYRNSPVMQSSISASLIRAQAKQMFLGKHPAYIKPFWLYSYNEDLRLQGPWYCSKAPTPFLPARHHAPQPVFHHTTLDLIQKIFTLLDCPFCICHWLTAKTVIQALGSLRGLFPTCHPSIIPLSWLWPPQPLLE